MAEYIEREAKNTAGCSVSKKIRTNFAKIIVSGTSEKPYYEIMYFDTEKKEFCIGFSSYLLDYVFKWLQEKFEIISETYDANVATVRHGRWLSWDELHGGNTRAKNVLGVFCSECKRQSDSKTQFCPNCGARMDKEDSQCDT